MAPDPRDQPQRCRRGDFKHFGVRWFEALYFDQVLVICLECGDVMYLVPEVAERHQARRLEAVS